MNRRNMLGRFATMVSGTAEIAAVSAGAMLRVVTSPAAARRETAVRKREMSIAEMRVYSIIRNAIVCAKW